MELGKTIKSYRNAKKATLKELAAEINVTASFLSDIENDKKLPSVDTLSKLAEAFNIPLYILFKEYSDLDINEATVNEHNSFMIQARALFLSDDLSKDDKEAIFKDITDLYWKAKGLLK